MITINFTDVIFDEMGRTVTLVRSSATAALVIRLQGTAPFKWPDSGSPSKCYLISKSAPFFTSQQKVADDAPGVRSKGRILQFARAGNRLDIHLQSNIPELSNFFQGHWLEVPEEFSMEKRPGIKKNTTLVVCAEIYEWQQAKDLLNLTEGNNYLGSRRPPYPYARRTKFSFGPLLPKGAIVVSSAVKTKNDGHAK